MLKHRAWQKGAADLATVAVGMIILSIVVAGTSSALVFGREQMLRQEHYKTAAYLLRGKMEEQMLAIQMIPDARARERLMRVEAYEPELLDVPGDRGGVEPVRCTVIRDMVESVDLPETKDSPDYFVLTMRARWSERKASTGNYNGNSRQQHEIVYTTAVHSRQVVQ